MEANNMKVMCKAVEDALWCLNWMDENADENTDNKSLKAQLAKPIELLSVALAAPARNCDVFNSEDEAKSAFIDWYNETWDLKGSKDAIEFCDLKHDVDGILHDYIEWLFDTAESKTKGETDGSFKAVSPQYGGQVR